LIEQLPKRRLYGRDHALKKASPKTAQLENFYSEVKILSTIRDKRVKKSGNFKYLETV